MTTIDDSVPGRIHALPGRPAMDDDTVPGRTHAVPGRSATDATPGELVPTEASPNGASPNGARPVVSPGDGKRGYQDPAEVPGRSIGELGYLVALAFAAGADVAAFHQIVSLVMPLQQSWLVWMMVMGFTAAALTLAHFAGRIGRDLTAKREPASARQLAVCLIPWAALGMIAFAVRLIVNSPTFGDTPAQQTTSALMFLALYGASGAVAGFGAYLTRNPLRVGYRRSLRGYRRALRQLAQSHPPYERAVSVLRQHEASRKREAANYAAARLQRLAFADEMKRYAAVLMAGHLQDPAATDGMTLPDRRPLRVPQPDRSEPGSNPNPGGNPTSGANPTSGRTSTLGGNPNPAANPTLGPNPAVGRAPAQEQDQTPTPPAWWATRPTPPSTPYPSGS